MESASRSQFTFYRSFLDVVEEMPEEEQLPVFKGIARYALDGVEPANLGPFGRVTWKALRPVLESGRAKALAGAATGRANAGKPCPAKVGNRNAARGDAADVAGASTPKRAARFVPPTVEEVAAYASEAGLKVDAGAFVDYFASNGWKIGGRAAMRDWRAAVRNWERGDRKRGGSNRQGDGAPTQAPLDLYDADGEL